MGFRTFPVPLTGTNIQENNLRTSPMEKQGESSKIVDKHVTIGTGTTEPSTPVKKVYLMNHRHSRLVGRRAFCIHLH